MKLCAYAWLIMVWAGCTVWHSGAATPAMPAARSHTILDKARASALRKTWGIEVVSLRLSAGGRMLDFRYNVVDANKAAKLAGPDIRPLLIDHATETVMRVPTAPKVGPLRPTAARLAPGKVYFMLFINSGRVVKSGSTITIVIGDARIEYLTVQ